MSKDIYIVASTFCNPPEGAQGRRIRCIAFALAAQRHNVYVLQNPTSLSAIPPMEIINDAVFMNLTLEQPRGRYYQSPPFRYAVRFVSYALGLSRLYGFLLANRFIHKKDFVMLLLSDRIFLMTFFRFFSKIVNRPLVKEIVEWYPCFDRFGRIRKMTYETVLPRCADSYMVISSYIKERIGEKNKPSTILRVPILFEEVQTGKMEILERRAGTFFWCGQIDGYLSSIFYLLDAFKAVLDAASCPVQLEFAGRYTKRTADEISRYCGLKGIELGTIRLLGFVDDATLYSRLYASIGLLVPLFNDIRSVSRFPTKLGEFLASGIPVITNAVGDLQLYLKDNFSALLARPDSVEGFAEKMLFVLEHREMAKYIGENGKTVAFNNFHYTVWGPALSRFVTGSVSTEP